MEQQIRVMTLEDLDKVHSIEKNAHVAPWNRQTIKDCIQVGYPGFVLEEKNGLESHILGYIIYRLHQKQCHILNLCVSRKEQGKGYGRQLMTYILNLLHQTACQSVVLEVRPKNQAAIDLYVSLGFERMGVKKGYYQDSEHFEDAILFKKFL